MASPAGWAGAGVAGTAQALHEATTVIALWANQITALGAVGRAAEHCETHAVWGVAIECTLALKHSRWLVL